MVCCFSYDIHTGSVEKAFLDTEGEFDICINCAAQTKYGQSEQVTNLL